MSSIWTPSGEHTPNDGPADGSGAGPSGGPPQGPNGDPPDQPEPTAEEIEALREVHARLVATPVEDVIANHALGLWQVALVHLGVITPPDETAAGDTGAPPAPDLASAGLAIDAMATIVDGLGPRLGVHEQVLHDALTQAQMLFVEVSDPASP